MGAAACQFPFPTPNPEAPETAHDSPTNFPPNHPSPPSPPNPPNATREPPNAAKDPPNATKEPPNATEAPNGTKEALGHDIGHAKSAVAELKGVAPSAGLAPFGERELSWSGEAKGMGGVVLSRVRGAPLVYGRGSARCFDPDARTQQVRVRLQVGHEPPTWLKVIVMPNVDTVLSLKLEIAHRLPEWSVPCSELRLLAGPESIVLNDLAPLSSVDTLVRRTGFLTLLSPRRDIPIPVSSQYERALEALVLRFRSQHIAQNNHSPQCRVGDEKLKLGGDEKVGGGGEVVEKLRKDLAFAGDRNRAHEAKIQEFVLLVQEKVAKISLIEDKLQQMTAKHDELASEISRSRFLDKRQQVHALQTAMATASINVLDDFPSSEQIVGRYRALVEDRRTDLIQAIRAHLRSLSPSSDPKNLSQNGQIDRKIEFGQDEYEKLGAGLIDEGKFVADAVWAHLRRLSHRQLMQTLEQNDGEEQGSFAATDDALATFYRKHHPRTNVKKLWTTTGLAHSNDRGPIWSAIARTNKSSLPTESLDAKDAIGQKESGGVSPNKSSVPTESLDAKDAIRQKESGGVSPNKSSVPTESLDGKDAIGKNEGGGVFGAVDSFVDAMAEVCFQMCISVPPLRLGGHDIGKPFDPDVHELHYSCVQHLSDAGLKRPPVVAACCHPALLGGNHCFLKALVLTTP